jgi:hypothetical protein
MQTALRVLSAITKNLEPSTADINSLLSYAGRQPDGTALDELACEVIQQALARRARVRAAAARESNR